MKTLTNQIATDELTAFRENFQSIRVTAYDDKLVYKTSLPAYSESCANQLISTLGLNLKAFRPSTLPTVNSLVITYK